MGLSRQTRIFLLLGIDSAFFVLELTVGILVKSLALYADAMHMLNDVLSLIVALYAIRLAAQTEVNHARLSFGWQRAEILGALINGVFLLALCFSIFLEAIQRFVDPPVITNPKLILIVGSAGLASNIVGLFLFHDHGHGGHDHGSEGDGHAHEDSGHTHRHTDEESVLSGTDVEAVLPETTVRRYSSGKHRRHRSSGGVGGAASNQHPVLARRSIVQEGDVVRANMAEQQQQQQHHHHESNGDHAVDERTPMLQHTTHKHATTGKDAPGGGQGGHSHGNLNMKGVFLHVLGDALGNIGVMITALFIWLTNFSWKYYADPVISLVITGIILSSSYPLVRSASFILLQAVPQGVNIDDVRDDILSFDGVRSLHELHIWQLSDSKLVASVHIRVSIPEDTAEYMELATEVRKCLHAYGIHSSTIQPEFVSADADEAVVEDRSTGGACLIGCTNASCANGQCCQVGVNAKAQQS